MEDSDHHPEGRRSMPGAQLCVCVSKVIQQKQRCVFWIDSSQADGSLWLIYLYTPDGRLIDDPTHTPYIHINISHKWLPCADLYCYITLGRAGPAGTLQIRTARPSRRRKWKMWFLIYFVFLLFSFRFGWQNRVEPDYTDDKKKTLKSLADRISPRQREMELSGRERRKDHDGLRIWNELTGSTKTCNFSILLASFYFVFLLVAGTRGVIHQAVRHPKDARGSLYLL